MLRGAVTFGEDFEEHYMKKIFDLDKGMTQAISHFSRHADAGKKIKKDGKYEYTGKSKITAETKICSFYRTTVLALGAAALVLFLITNASYWFDKKVVELPKTDKEIATPNPPMTPEPHQK